ncbi:calcium/sodium antiporter [Candidatus Enterovibrio escicola]|uniref:Inner membrane protein YrbG n=1 Tax=Candidatus Enterovibrio escicola TaxID=1927127 RepID=A0A2A5T5B1_9GAMM|nr:calcium/sodium antiporter [Candidatus Enterovibrio escacola]PCS23336.1 Inner membrane protein YrbG [Candidatus Enterovibrio escacola]
MSETITMLVSGLCLLASYPYRLVYSFSAQEVLSDNSHAAVGDILHSNITNITIIPSISTLIQPLSISSNLIHRQLPLMLIIIPISSVISWNATLRFHKSILLSILFNTFWLILLKIVQENTAFSLMLTKQETKTPQDVSNIIATISLIMGFILVISSAGIIVSSYIVTLFIYKTVGISDLIIDLIIVAEGISHPELFALISSVLKGEDNLVFNYIMSSNIFDIPAIITLAEIINPSVLNPLLTIERDFCLIFAVSVLLFLFRVSKSHPLNRWKRKSHHWSSSCTFEAICSPILQPNSETL